MNEVQDAGFMGWEINDLVNTTMQMKATENLRSKMHSQQNTKPCNTLLLSLT
jgi:hypothetical protein